MAQEPAPTPGAYEETSITAPPQNKIIVRPARNPKSFQLPIGLADDAVTCAEGASGRSDTQGLAPIRAELVGVSLATCPTAWVYRTGP